MFDLKARFKYCRKISAQESFKETEIGISWTVMELLDRTELRKSRSSTEMLQ